MNDSRDFVERIAPLWHLLFYGTLAVSAVIALLIETDTDSLQKIWTALLTLGLAGWHYFLNVRLTNPHPGIMLIYVVGAVASIFALINLQPIYWLMVFPLVGITFNVLPLGRAIAVSVGITAIMVWQAFLSRGLTAENLIGAAVLGIASIGFASFFGWFIDRIVRESDERKKLIQQLNATRAELARREREAGMMQERQRLAREIHDTLAQGFTSIVLQLEAAEQALATDSAAAQKYLDTARRTARSSLEEARRVVADLRPELLESDSLPNALKRTVQRWSEENHTTADINISGEITPLAPELEITLLRAAQEALNNIRKHAHAEQVELSLAYLGYVVTLDLHDDGDGINENAAAPNALGGFGLVAMRERVESLGGQLAVESAPAEGTTIAVQLPTNLVQSGANTP